MFLLQVKLYCILPGTFCSSRSAHQRVTFRSSRSISYNIKNLMHLIVSIVNHSIILSNWQSLFAFIPISRLKWFQRKFILYEANPIWTLTFFFVYSPAQDPLSLSDTTCSWRFVLLETDRETNSSILYVIHIIFL